MKRPITMLAIGAILIGGTVPAAALSSVEDDALAVGVESAAAAPTSSPVDSITSDDVQTFASPSGIAAAPIARDSFDVEKVKQQVVVTAAGVSGMLELFPANGPINDTWGYRGTEFHSGIDIMAPKVRLLSPPPRGLSRVSQTVVDGAVM